MIMKTLRETYPRRRNLKRLYTKDVEALTAIVGAENAVYQNEENQTTLDAHNKDWLGQIQGASKMVLYPRSTAHLSEVLKYCHSDRIAVVPQGGNTGLVYGSVPLFDEVIISMRKHRLEVPKVNEGGNVDPFASTMQFNPETMSCVCSASVILEDLQKFATSKNRIAPLDMGSRGSCTIGGNLATNAGGIHYARYGSLRTNTIGIEVVCADGAVVSTLRDPNTKATPVLFRKDNSIGLDMSHLFIGSEGTLGIISAAELLLHPKPTNHQLLMYHVGSSDDVLKLFQLAKQSLHNSLSAFEVMDLQGLSAGFELDALKDVLPSVATALESGESAARPSFCVMIEVQSTDAEVDQLRIERLVSAVGDGKSAKVAVVDQIMADSIASVKKIWAVREELPVKLAQKGRIYKFDLCFPFDKFYNSVEFARAKFVKDIFGEDYLSRDYTGGSIPSEVLETLQYDVCFSGYGHFGDGNVHLNIVDRTPEGYYSEYIKDDLSPAIYDFCVRTGGSVSAEHGIGLQKKPYLYASRDRPSIEAMKTVKRVMDPKAILNPYKLL